MVVTTDSLDQWQIWRSNTFCLGLH